MKFKARNTRELAKIIVGDEEAEGFPYRTTTVITEFFEDCELDYVHDGSTRWRWAQEVVEKLLEEPQLSSNTLPENLMHLLRVLMDKTEAAEGDEDRSIALKTLNVPLKREGFEAFYNEDDLLYIRHIGTKTVSRGFTNPHRPLTTKEMELKGLLEDYLNICSEDELIENILLPLFRHLGFQRITAVGHKDKSLEYGKDIWMRYVLPTQHILYFGIQTKKGKLDASGRSRSTNTNVAEIHNQALMMLGHEIFDSETNKKALVDHAFIISAGEITKQAKNWLGGKLDASKRSQILFMDRKDIVDLYVTNQLSLPKEALPQKVEEDEFNIPF